MLQRRNASDFPFLQKHEERNEPYSSKNILAVDRTYGGVKTEYELVNTLKLLIAYKLRLLTLLVQLKYDSL